MTSKERVLTAIAHQEPDRVPIGEWEFGKEIVGPVLGEQDISFSGMGRTKALWEGRRDEVVGQRKRALTKIIERFGWDTVLVHLMIDSKTPVEVPEPIGERTWRRSNGDVLTYSEETDRILITKRGPRATGQALPPPTKPAEVVPTDSELELVRYIVEEFGRTHFVFAAPLIGHPQLRFLSAGESTLENWVRLYEDPDAYAEKFLQRMTGENLRMGVEIAKREKLDGVAFGCDFGYNTGPFMSPEMFRRAILPGLAAFCEMVHEHRMTMLLHSCGNNQALMDMIVEAGVDVYQSIQPEMDIVEMKRRYGKNITLWGGVPAGDLVLSTPDKVRDEAIEYLEACKPGGGYIFGTSHSIMPGAKWENYMAMIDAWKQHATYGSIR